MTRPELALCEEHGCPCIGGVGREKCLVCGCLTPRLDLLERHGRPKHNRRVRVFRRGWS